MNRLQRGNIAGIIDCSFLDDQASSSVIWTACILIVLGLFISLWRFKELYQKISIRSRPL